MKKGFPTEMPENLFVFISVEKTPTFRVASNSKFVTLKNKIWKIEGGP